jgi:hypothetical protein
VSTATDSPTTIRKPFDRRFVSPLLIGSTLNPINSSMIATGLVGIGLDFHNGPGTTASLIRLRRTQSWAGVPFGAVSARWE